MQSGGRVDFRSYFSFQGRMFRRPFFLFYGLPFFALGALPGLLLPHGATQVALESLVLLLVLPGIARRLHDVGYALWRFLGVWAIYGIVLATQLTGVFGERRSLVILLSSVPFLVVMIALFLVCGAPGPNRFGDSPSLSKDRQTCLTR